MEKDKILQEVSEKLKALDNEVKLKILSLLVEEGAKRNQREGLWKKRGQRLMIVLENGPKFVVGVVTSATNHLVLAGIDASPRWFRFARVF